MWIVTIIVCIIAGFIVQPMDRIIEKKVSSKWLVYLLQVFALFIILIALFGIAILFGINNWE